MCSNVSFGTCRYSYLSTSIQPIWLLDTWAAGHLRCRKLLTSLFGSIQLVNASLTLASSWRFCRTEFLWKGIQTQKKKSGLATRDYQSPVANQFHTHCTALEKKQHAFKINSPWLYSVCLTQSCRHPCKAISNVLIRWDGLDMKNTGGFPGQKTYTVL